MQIRHNLLIRNKLRRFLRAAGRKTTLWRADCYKVEREQRVRDKIEALARGASDELRSDGYLALTIRSATLSGGSSKAPFLLETADNRLPPDRPARTSVDRICRLERRPRLCR